MILYVIYILISVDTMSNFTVKTGGRSSSKRVLPDNLDFTPVPVSPVKGVTSSSTGGNTAAALTSEEQISPMQEVQLTSNSGGGALSDLALGEATSPAPPTFPVDYFMRTGTSSGDSCLYLL